jgi:transposase
VDLPVLGIDVGKFEFHCALSVKGQVHTNHFPHSEAGFERLYRWLANRRISRVHACMESTGGWSEELAADLHEHGHVVSIVNPLAIKSFGQSELSRTKTDKADAALIARFCITMHPALWEPPSPLQQRLRRLGRRRVALDEMRVQESNRLGAPGSSDVRSSIEATISFLDRQIDEIDAQIRSLIDDDLTLRGKRELLMSIPGIGERLAVTILGELPNISEFRSAKALSSFTGLCPREFRSGKSVSASWLSKTGNAHLRRMLYMPALAAIRCNPILKDFAKRLRSSGKHGKQIVAAVMRRLLVLAFGVIKSGHPFDPEIGCGRRHGHHPRPSRRRLALDV